MGAQSAVAGNRAEVGNYLIHCAIIFNYNANNSSVDLDPTLLTFASSALSNSLGSAHTLADSTEPFQIDDASLLDLLPEDQAKLESVN
jgi:hypothetical protein